MREIIEEIDKEIERLQNFRNEIKWIDRGKTEWKGEGIDPLINRDRALEALKRLKGGEFADLVEKYKVTIPEEKEMING